jgi:hypothetical protein
MKTNQVRSHRNGARPSSQAKTTRRVGGKKSSPENNSVGLIFFDDEAGSVSPGIELSAGEFAAIQKDAAARGESLDAWLVRTIEETPALRSSKINSQEVAS